MVLLTASEHSKKMKGAKNKLLTSFTLGIFSLIAAIVLMVIDPTTIVTKMSTKLAEGSPMFEFLKKPMDNVYISAYLFNITNAERFLSGEDDKIKVQEVGPFTYLEIRNIRNLSLDVEAGTMKYEPHSTIRFLPEKSVGDPDHIYVTMPNLPMLGLASAFSKHSYWTRMAFSLLVSQLKSKPIVNVTVSPYLWGYKEPLVSFANSVVPGFIHFDKMGILDRLYDKKSSNELEVGATPEDRFMIKTRNEHKKLAMGDMKNPDKCAICDDFVNCYEGIIYPLAITEKTPIRIFRNGLCRTLDMVYHKKIVTDMGIEALMYNLSESFYSLDKNVTENRILDLTDCFYGLPVALTKVKFLGMDPEIYDKIEGITPDPSKECYVVIEPKVALTLETNFPVQMNLDLKDLSYINSARLFSNMILPIGYVEITQPPLPEETMTALYKIYTMGPAITLTSRVLLILSAGGFFTYSLIELLGLKRTKMITFSGLKMNSSLVLNVQEPLVNGKLSDDKIIFSN